MSEPIYHQFKRLICALLKRDGVDRGNGVRLVRMGDLDIVSANGYLIAELHNPEATAFPARIQVYNTLDDEYSIPHMSELIPKLNRMLILERLADV